MRVSATLLIVAAAFTSASAQPNAAGPASPGPTAVTPVIVPVSPQLRQIPQGYSRGTYSRGTYSRPTRPSRGTYSRSTWKPQATYSRSGAPQAGNLRSNSSIVVPADTDAPASPTPTSPAGPPADTRTPAGAQNGAPPNSQQTGRVNRTAEQQRIIQEEQWRQYQIQEAQRLADIQRYGDAASQKFWQDIYRYNRSTFNQSRHGYSDYGQSRIGQNYWGYSTYGQSRAGQSFSHPSFYNQSRFNQSPPIYSFHNIIVPGAGHWTGP